MILGYRNSRIDQLRGLSIILVLLHHFDIAYKLPPTFLGSLIGPEAIQAIVRNGNYGVTIFFVISGFLITSNSLHRWQSLDRIEMKAFYQLRFTRIMPCLFLLLGIVAALDAFGVELFQSRMPETNASVSALLVYGAALSFTMNILVEGLGWVNYPLGVLWSLAVEGVFYVTFPWVCYILKRTRYIALFWTVIVIIGPLYRAFYQGDSGAYLYDYISAFDGIAIGCLAALAAARLSIPSKVSIWLIPLTIISMTAFYLSAPISESNIWGITLMAFGTAIMLLATSREASDLDVPRWRITGVVEYLGRQSYEIDLFHLIILGLMRTWIPSKAASVDQVLFLLVLFIILLASLAAVIKRFYTDPLDRVIRLRHKVTDAAL